MVAAVLSMCTSTMPVAVHSLCKASLSQRKPRLLRRLHACIQSERLECQACLFWYRAP